ncbi:TIGR00180 family glycosyltransferase [Pseudomonas sp. 14P_8.1_Bac3]|uniref:glycosyltransferase family 2 protein n=1 Tax=Pseudomonas sp. 14P_8.1_Bac3 TaxID=2971621 RepID=UPI0021C9B737|nr:TIGR00180 family glycosyltransferase [Pseudomonas sp. 14P_8.1_Bac3]MCU1759176.1 TIGR00180 family glycosyltransferase [Pseudomonas sp. 14P_8.1_Bac3]
MQSKFTTGTDAPLNERFTLVLLACDQPRSLRRALRYYSDLPCTVLVVDASREADADIADLFSTVRYLHAPATQAQHFSVRVRQVLGQITTPYMAVVEAESFLLPEALEQSLAFLEANADYGTCQGYSLAFEAHADRVDYYLRDRKGCEDYSDDSAEARLAILAADTPSLATAVTRTAVLQRWYATLAADFNPALQENGYSHGLTAGAKVRLLPVPYALHHRYSMTFGAITEKLFESTWDAHLAAPLRRFEPAQYVELPFYNQAFFDVLTALEFLLHAVPTGQVQLEELEAAMFQQKELSRVHRNASAEPLNERLLKAFELYAFNQDVVQQLARSLQNEGAKERAQTVLAWGQRLAAATLENNGRLFDATRTGRLLQWLEARDPSAAQVKDIGRHLARNAGGPTFGILLLDLEADIFKLQATFDSVMNSYCRAFKIIVFTTGDLPAETTLQNTLHFVKVNESNYVDKINQVVSQTDCDWMVLAEAGEELTPSGLYQASLELLAAPQCRAVAMDEFQRQENGTLVDVFRPGFNLDLLQSYPGLMARHWLVRRDVMVEAGGYSREFKKALEFDLLLRLIEQGGLDGLAHLDEPLLVGRAPEEASSVDERKTLLRHLATRGYQADVSTLVPGTHKIDYRFTERPMVSVILHGVSDLETLQRCIRSVLQRTRYQRYELLLADDSAYAAPLGNWLDSQGPQANRVRLFSAEPGLATGRLINTASQHAQGEYLVTLAADSEVVNVNWIESLLNQVLRPEIGVAGAKLVDQEGRITQAGLILGFNDGVGSPFVGESKTARGYMNRLVVEQNCSAVSFACLMISKQLFEAADGIDVEHFAEAFGDVDLCLRVGQAGYLTVWTPHVQVIQSGVLSHTAAARQVFGEKWADALGHDRFYNKNLAASGAGFDLGPVTSIDWPALIKPATA